MASDVPWFPESLSEYAGTAVELRARWCYVVVEEVIDRTALLQRWPWPLADEHGRLFWPAVDQESVVEAAIRVATLEGRLYRPHHVRRHPRVGDTFAVLGDDAPGWESEVLVEEIRQLFPSLVLDVSAEARAAARLAYEGSLVRPVPEEHVDPVQVHKARARRQRLTSRTLLKEPGSAQPADPDGGNT